MQGDELRVGVEAAALRAWAVGPPRLQRKWPRVALAGLSASILLLLMAWAAGTLTLPFAGVLLVVGVAQGLIVLWLRRSVTSVVHAIDEPTRDLELLASILRLLEREKFASTELERPARRSAASDDWRHERSRGWDSSSPCFRRAPT